MKLSTYINAAIKANGQAFYLLAASSKPFALGHTDYTEYERSCRQAAAFHARAVQLADEQHDLIVMQEERLDQFAQALQEVQS